MSERNLKLEIFKPEDFDYTATSAFPAAMQASAVYAALANARLNEWLKTEAKKVECHKLGESNLTNEHGPGWVAAEKSTRNQVRFPTHQALLICIEPIEKCSHPKEKVTFRPGGWECECGAKV